MSNAAEALSHIQKAMEHAYHSAIPVCCERGTVHGCCGEPEPSWPEWAESVMKALDPVETELRQFLQDVERKKLESIDGDKAS